MNAVAKILRSVLVNGRLSSRVPVSYPAVHLADHCTQCRHRHSVSRPLKPKEEDVNSLYEDPKLNVLPEREEYTQIWLHVQGYDFAPVESYSKFLHHFVKTLDTSANAESIPPRTWDFVTYKRRSVIVDESHSLKKYHRLIKVNGLPNNIVSLLVDMVTRHLPTGVELSFTEPDADLMEFKYVPDADVIALQQELTNLDDVD